MKHVGNSSRGRSQGVPKIFSAPMYEGALRGHLCYSTAFLLLLKLLGTHYYKLTLLLFTVRPHH